MAIRLPNNLYSEGQVALNSNAFTNFYLQSKIRQRAKEEALDNYFMNFSKSVNPAGMRTQDIENGWSQKVNDWQSFYNQNADAIKHPLTDNGRARNEFEARYQDLLNDTQRSKNEVLNTTKAAPVFTDPNKRTRLTDGTIEDFDRSQKSIYDQDFKPFDLSSLDFDAKPFDAAAQAKYLHGVQNGLTMGDIVSKTEKDAKNHQLINTYHSTYSPETLNALYKRAATGYRSDPSIKEFVDNELSSPIIHQELNDKFKATYGKDIETPEDMAAAWTLNSIQTERDKQKATSYNPFLGQRSGGSNAAANNFNFGVEMTNALRTNDLNKVNDLKHILSGGSGKVNLIDAFPRKEGGVDYIYLQLRDKDTDGYFGEPYTKKYAVNDPALPNILTDIYQNVMSADANQEKLQYPTKQTTVVPPNQNNAAPQKQKATTSKTYDVGGKKYTHDDLKKMGYTDEQIAQAIKLGTIKE